MTASPSCVPVAQAHRRRAGEHVVEPEPSPMRAKPSREERFAVAARFFERLRAQERRFHPSVLPQRGVLDVVLQIAVGGARGSCSRMDKNTDRDEALG